MKEELKKMHGDTKRKDLFTFDYGLAERQSAFLVVARPLLAALTALDNSGGEDEDDVSRSSSLKLVNVLCEKVSQQISTFSQISSMQRSRVNMTIAQLTTSLSAHQPPNTSPKDHTGGSSPFVETTVPLTTVELEETEMGIWLQV